MIGRLVRGLVSFGQLVWAKVGARGTSSRSSLGAGIALVFGIVTEVGEGSKAASRGSGCRCCLAGIALAER